MKRRDFLINTALGAAALSAPHSLTGCSEEKKKKFKPAEDYFVPFMNLKSKITSPVVIEKINLFNKKGDWLLIVRSQDGANGVIITDSRIPHFLGILEGLVIPYFIGKDAREIETIIDGVYRYGRNYKFAGLPLWDCIAHVELAIWDLLGKSAGVPVHQLIGNKLRDDVDIYLSSTERKTTAEEEVEWLSDKFALTNAKALKYKIGGNMSYNKDSIPGRSEKLIPLARKTFGDDIHLFVDANGSYDAEHGIKWAKMLDEYNYEFFEEPCPWQDYESTRHVTENVSKIKIAGGEQDSSLYHFKWMIENGVFDIIQFDIPYCGGLVRALRITKMARDNGLDVVPHCPKADPRAAYMLHLAAVTPNLFKYQEYYAKGKKWKKDLYSPQLKVVNGKIEIPKLPGLGYEFNMDFIYGMDLII